jgi:hypothetical protein
MGGLHNQICDARTAAFIMHYSIASLAAAPTPFLAYRALEHNKTKDACRNSGWIRKFPKAIQDFADTFVAMQEKRHAADYDPHICLSKTEVDNDIELVIKTIENFKTSSIKDRRAFCAYVLLKVRV